MDGKVGRPHTQGRRFESQLCSSRPQDPAQAGASVSPHHKAAQDESRYVGPGPWRCLACCGWNYLPHAISVSPCPGLWDDGGVHFLLTSVLRSLSHPPRHSILPLGQAMPCPFCRWRNRGSERSCDLARVTHSHGSSVLKPSPVPGLCGLESRWPPGGLDPVGPEKFLGPHGPSCPGRCMGDWDRCLGPSGEAEDACFPPSLGESAREKPLWEPGARAEMAPWPRVPGVYAPLPPPPLKTKIASTVRSAWSISTPSDSYGAGVSVASTLRRRKRRLGEVRQLA